MSRRTARSPTWPTWPSGPDESPPWRIRPDCHRSRDRGGGLAVDLLGVALVLDHFGRVIAPGGAGVVIASMAARLYPPLDPGVERQLATTPADDLLNLDACSPAHIPDSRQAYPFAKRANQIRVAAAAATWGRPGARINCISPGISTAMGRLELSGESGSLMQTIIDNAGLRRIGTPDDIAAAAEFLLGSGLLT